MSSFQPNGSLSIVEIVTRGAHPFAHRAKGWGTLQKQFQQNNAKGSAVRLGFGSCNDYC
jgi:hypothetical protein